MDEQSHFCEIDSNAVMTKFMTHILASTFILRAYGYFKYRNSNPINFKEHGLCTTILFNGSYGLWTLINLAIYMKSSQVCKEVYSFNMFNFQLVLLMGCFPAVNTIFATLIVLILAPVFAW